LYGESYLTDYFCNCVLVFSHSFIESLFLFPFISFFLQFAADPDTLITLTTLMRIAIPPHCNRHGSGIADLALGSHCLACIKAVLEKGYGMEEFARQAATARLALCLLEFLEWDDNGAPPSDASSENYANKSSGLAEDGKVSLRVYSVSVVKMLLRAEHSAVATRAVVNDSGGRFAAVWSKYKEQSLDLFVSETERRRLLLGDVVAKFLTN